MTSLVYNFGVLLSVALLGNAASVGEDYGELQLVHLVSDFLIFLSYLKQF